METSPIEAKQKSFLKSNAWILCWFLLSGLLVLFLYNLFYSESQKKVFLPGKTTSGHYQIEQQCNLCHDPFMGVKEQACLDCHQEELHRANDSHPQIKFTDPRNADRVAILDARKCTTCHVEHRPAFTHSMGLTLPKDYCFHCHKEIGEERPSHRNLPYDSCATSGCHNFHDNQALYEDFLEKHLDDADFNAKPFNPMRDLMKVYSENPKQKIQVLTVADQDAKTENNKDQEIVKSWAKSKHAQQGVNCSHCHSGKNAEKESNWIAKPIHENCKDCHEAEVDSFLLGKHGMRLVQGLSPMTPALARIPMHADAHTQSLSCSSCHSAHDYNTQTAAVDACLNCHADNHSLAFKDSPHFQLWQKEVAGDAPKNSGVSCATCHLPRVTHKKFDLESVTVQHNQNDNLKPNEKMIRTVCMNCHGLGFSIDALADAELIQKNFKGKPAKHIESLDWVRQRVEARKKK